MCLVYDAWARSFRKSPWAGCVLNKDYDTVSRNTIGEILDRGARVIVAVQDIEGGRRVMGYSVSEPDIAVLHWIYVKDTYRVKGLQVGSQLLAETTKEWHPGRGKVYTHRTPASSKFLGQGWTHDPVAARVKR
jgi:hypothetical protein